MGATTRAATAVSEVRRKTRTRRLRGGIVQRLTTNDVLKDPALPHATRMNHRPGVVLVPTFHVQETRLFRGRFG